MFKTATSKSILHPRLPLALQWKHLKAGLTAEQNEGPRRTWAPFRADEQSPQLIYLLDIPAREGGDDLYGVIAYAEDDGCVNEMVSLGHFERGAAGSLFNAFRFATVLMREALPRNARNDAVTWPDFVRKHITYVDRPEYHFPRA